MFEMFYKIVIYVLWNDDLDACCSHHYPLNIPPIVVIPPGPASWSPSDDTDMVNTNMPDKLV